MPYGHRAAVLVAVAGVLALSGCGAAHHKTTASAGAAVSSPAPRGSEAPSPKSGTCSLVSPATVVAAFRGRVVAFSETVTGTGNPQCTFTLRGTNLGELADVIVNKHTSESASDFAAAARLATKDGAAEVSGVGSAAYYDKRTGTLRFHENKASVALQAGLQTGPVDAAKAAVLEADLITLARGMKV